MIKKQAKKVNKNLGVNQKSLPFLPAKIKNSAKKLKVGFVYYLTSLLVFISLVSIGFASWTIITFPNGQTATGTITAYDVINTEDYIQLDKTKGDLVAGSTEEHTGVTMFEISKFGFLVGGETVKDGGMTAYYNLNLGKIRESSAFGETITIEFYLRGVRNDNNHATILSTVNIYVASAKITVNGEQKVSKRGTELGAPPLTQLTIGTQLTVSDYAALDTVPVVVTFSFDLSTNAESFYNEIVGENEDKETEFYLHARIY